MRSTNSAAMIVALLAMSLVAKNDSLCLAQSNGSEKSREALDPFITVLNSAEHVIVGKVLEIKQVSVAAPELSFIKDDDRWDLLIADKEIASTIQAFKVRVKVLACLKGGVADDEDIQVFFISCSSADLIGKVPLSVPLDPSDKRLETILLSLKKHSDKEYLPSGGTYWSVFSCMYLERPRIPVP